MNRLYKLLTEFDTTWRKSVRRVLSLSITAHDVLIPMLDNGLNFKYLLHKNFINFVSSFVHSSNLILLFISNVACTSQRHCIGCNMSIVCQHMVQIQRYTCACQHVSYWLRMNLYLYVAACLLKTSVTWK